jgi:putative acetyltransferase
MLIRQETKNDYKAIRQLNDGEFGGSEQSYLIDQLRSDSLVLLSLVADEGGDMIGHILFSRIQIDPPKAKAAPIAAVALGPMCVSSVHQKKGVGGALIQQGLRILKQRGESIVFVLGHKKYYPKFGFTPELAAKFSSEHAGGNFFAIELQPGWAAGKSGAVRYPDAFSRIS